MKVLQHLLFLSFAAVMVSIPGYAQEDKYGTTEEQRINCKEALSVYKSYKKQKNYDEAYIQWRKACAVCPEQASEGIYADGASFVGKELKKIDADDPRHGVLVDSLMFLARQAHGVVPKHQAQPQQPLRSAWTQGR